MTDGENACTDAARLMRMVERDGSGAVRDVLRVAQSDIMSLLCEYMAVTRLNIDVDRDADGYKMTIEVRADRFYGIGKLSAPD